MTKSVKKTRWGRVAIVWVCVAAGIFIFIPREKLPAFVKNETLVVKAYDWKDGPDKAASRIEPAAGETGYKADDRRELDSLISRGTYQ